MSKKCPSCNGTGVHSSYDDLGRHGGLGTHSQCIECKGTGIKNG